MYLFKINISPFFSLFLMVLMLPVFSYSQRTITGVLTDMVSGDVLIGANIMVKNTAIGTVTDYNGQYSLDIPAEGEILVFSYIGYQEIEKNIDNREVINVSMVAGELLEEVVMIGYGTIKRKDVTGSLQSVSSKDFNKGAVTGPQQLLAGKVAGVSISTDGTPGGGSTIRIRGQSSLNATNDPLIVVDGIPLDNGRIHGGRNNLNVINPADIEAMTVLKDASATAIYGNRASAGVILITTKKGKVSDGLKLGYNAKFSVGKVTNKVDVLSTEEFRNVIFEKYDEESDQRLLLGDASTDWQDEIYQDAFGQDHSLTVSGGIGLLPFRASLGYTNNKGLLLTDEFNRLSGSLNLTPGFLNNTLQVNLGLKAIKTNNHFADHGTIGSAVGFDPTQSIYSDNNDYGGYFAWRTENGDLVGLAPANPLTLLYQKEDISEVDRYIVNASFDYRFWFLPALRANMNLGYDYSLSGGTTFIDTTAAFVSSKSENIDQGGVDNSYNQHRKNTLLEFYLNYKEQLFGNDFDMMVGYSWQRFYNDDNSIRNNILGSIPPVDDADAEELYMLSLFSRINYNINDFVYLTATLRQDHTSRFAPENRVGLFPALGLAFHLLDNENNYFNNIKARLGWGITGQQDLRGYYLYQGTYVKSFDNARYQFGDDFITTYRPNGYDEAIKWETTRTFNFGLDMSIINKRISSTIDVYFKATKDLLNYEVQVPVGSNLTNVVATNIGDMESKGIEFSLNTTPIQKDNFYWDFNFNISYNKSKITKLNINDDGFQGALVGGISGGVGNTIQINSIDYEPYAYYVYEQIYDEGGQLIPGEFVDRNGDSIINYLDKYRIETSTPNWVIGLSSSINYKDFSFSFAGRAHLGHQIYNNVQTSIGYQDRLSKNGVLENIHTIGIDNNIKEQDQATYSDYYIQDATFFRMDHITLGYDLKKLTGLDINVYSTVQNPFIITKYVGFDPEVFQGRDNNIYPRARVYLLGLSAAF